MIRRSNFLLVFSLLCIFPVHSFQNGEPLRSWVIEPAYATTPPRIPQLLPFKGVQRPKIALVLSGGGARGVASIGVIEAFEEAGVPIDFIAGTSIGSIIGGLYAAGYSTVQLKAMVDTTNWDDLLSFTDEARRRDLFYDQKLAEDRSILVLRFDGLEPVIPESFSTGQRLTNYLNLHALQSIYHPNPSFDDLRIPFRAVATDLVSGKRVILDRGDLSEALRASVSVPLLFSTVKRDTTQLLDGGLVSNIPADVARDWGADIVVVVDVTSPLRPASRLNAPWEIADQLIGITVQLANREQLRHADYVIKPKIGDHLSSDFTALDSLMERGREATAEMLPLIRERVRNRAAREVGGGRIKDFVNPTILFDAQQLGESWRGRLRQVARQERLSDQDVRALATDMYASGDFERVEVDVREYQDHSLLRLTVTPNPVLRRLEIMGNTIVPTDTLTVAFRDVIGKRVNIEDCQKAVEDFLLMYRQRGYSLAKIRSIEFDRASGVARISLDEGVVYRRTIEGTKKTKDYVIWRELPWKQGDVFQVSKVAEGVTNLYGTNLFEQVSIRVLEEGAEKDHQVVIINARERHTDLIRLGLTIDNERNVQPLVDVRDENFLGIGSELGVRFFGGLRNRYYLGEFKANRVFNSYLTFSLKGLYALRDVNSFVDEPLGSTRRWNRVREGEYRTLRESFSVSVGTQLERIGLVNLEGRIEHQRLWSIFNRPVPNAEFHVSAVKIGTRVDSQDRFPFPREGEVMEFYYESGFVKSTSSLGFTKFFFSYESYKTPFERQTIRPKVVFGFADETVPLTEQFSLGGQQSFLGLREDNALGRQLFLISLEYRYALPFRILFDSYVKLRYDLGSIWAEAEQIRLKDLRHGVGASLALDTPIGPFEVSVGRSFFIRKDLLNDPLSYGPIVAYFRLGHAF